MNEHEHEKKKFMEESYEQHGLDKAALINEVKEVNKLVNLYHNEAIRRKNKYTSKLEGIQIEMDRLRS